MLCGKLRPIITELGGRRITFVFFHMRSISFLPKHFKEIGEIFFALTYALFLRIVRKGPNRVDIYYHSVKKEDSRQFEKQMAYLANKCKVVKLSEIKKFPIKGKETLIAITFDDAYVNVFKNTVPILKKYGFTAGVFVPTGNLGQKPRWDMPGSCPDKKEIVMTKEQIKQLDKDGFEIFSHTVSHPSLTEIEDSRLKAELVESKKSLEAIVGHDVTAISFPYGKFNTKVCDAAEDANYKYGFTVEPRTVIHSSDNMQIGRFELSPKDNLLKFKLKVAGAYEIAMYLRRLKKLFVCETDGSKK